MAIKKLDNELLFTLANLQCLQSEEDKYFFCLSRICEEEYRAAKAYTAVYTHIYCFKKVYK